MYDNNVASSTSTKEKCPYCGSVIEAGSRFCGHCGGKIERPTHIAENAPYQTPTYSQGPKMKAPFGTGAMVCSIIGMGLLLLLFIIASENEDLYPFFGMMAITGLAVSIVGMALGIPHYLAYSLPEGLCLLWPLQTHLQKARTGIYRP